MLKAAILFPVLFASCLALANFPSIEQCAIVTASARTERIYRGKITELGEYPFAALLEYTDGAGSTKYSCAGTLINSRTVLTSAYCITSVPPLWKLENVILGEWDRTTDPDCVKVGGEKICAPVVQRIPIERATTHEDFDRKMTLLNDIGIIRLARDAELNDFVRPLCLPTVEELIQRNNTNENFVVVGWGKTEQDKISKKQRMVEVKGVSVDACQEIYKTEQRVAITADQICALGEGGQDACSDDSGGPLIGTYQDKDGKSFRYLAGIVSAGKGCGNEYPGIYTRVGSYVNWIEKISQA